MERHNSFARQPSWSAATAAHPALRRRRGGAPTVMRADTALLWRVIAGFAMAGTALALILAMPTGARAQTSPGIGINNNDAAFREGTRRRMDNFRYRMQRGHEIGQQRALDTADRVGRRRERQLDREEDVRRRRSQ